MTTQRVDKLEAVIRWVAKKYVDDAHRKIEARHAGVEDEGMRALLIAIDKDAFIGAMERSLNGDRNDLTEVELDAGG